MQHKTILLTTSEANALIQCKKSELSGVAGSSTNSKYVTSYGKVVFRIVAQRIDGKKLWSIDPLCGTV